MWLRCRRELDFQVFSRKVLGYSMNCVWRVFEGCSEPNGQKLEARARQNAKSVVLSTVFGLLWGGWPQPAGERLVERSPPTRVLTKISLNKRQLDRGDSWTVDRGSRSRRQSGQRPPKEPPRAPGEPQLQLLSQQGLPLGAQGLSRVPLWLFWEPLRAPPALELPTGIPRASQGVLGASKRLSWSIQRAPRRPFCPSRPQASSLKAQA